MEDCFDSAKLPGFISVEPLRGVLGTLRVPLEFCELLNSAALAGRSAAAGSQNSPNFFPGMIPGEKLRREVRGVLRPLQSGKA
ncbi:MAG: hypothetical protein LBU18_00210 [Treponema sp.]|nr:hypothetical protein [Treponema sp.]